jgi:hypothetical protein
MLRLHAHHRSAACAIIFVLPLRLAAAQEGRPAAPDSVMPHGHLSSAVATPAAATGLGPAGPISDGQFVVLMAAGPTALALDTVRTRTAVEPGCPEHALAGELPAGTDADSAALGGQTLVVIVVGAHRATNSCQVEWNLSPFTIWRAAALPGAQGSIARAPMAARLIVDGAAIEPLRAYLRPAYRRLATGWEREGNQLRYYYDMSVVRPRADGRPHQMAVRIWDRAPAPVTIDVESVDAERLALEYVSARLAEPRSGDSASRLVIRPLVPIRGDLQRIFDSSRADVVAAGMHAAAWATTVGDSAPSNRAVARLLTAEALLARREPELAQAMVVSVQREHPCLVPPAGSSSTVVELARTNRAGVPCQPVSPVRAAALSIVPGLGSYVANDRIGAVVGAAVVGGAIAAAFHYESQAKSRYQAYLASRDPVQISLLYQSVTDLRTQRGVAIDVAIGSWIVDALWAIHRANVHNARIADDRF